MFDSCTLKTGGCVASLPDDGCYWYRFFKDLIKKTENPWHTGTPTEEGDYYIAFRNFIGADIEYGWASWDGEGWDINFLGWHFSNEILAWQKIEPYKDKEDEQVHKGR